MRGLAIALTGLACAALPLPALAKDAAVEAPIRTFVASFNKGDVPAAAATHDRDVAIIDEVAPYRWSGAGAFDGWLAALAADSRAKGITDQSVTISDPTRELVTGADAYVVVPAVYRFRQKGVAMTETAQFAFSLHKGEAGWKISGWTWTGPDAVAAR
ncbi:hypothetical protein U1839_17520 [Sphingomonas sp. RT2P30]|uniref:hypothetical protein n=1 Tax=Parasphingomonas halimpatiens TaxID=3096162 RepID=UPI002FC6EF2A